jgi:hypothetical protein
VSREEELALRTARIRYIQRTWRDVGRRFDAVADTMVPGGQLRDTSQAVYALGEKLRELSEMILEMNELIFNRPRHDVSPTDDVESER